MINTIIAILTRIFTNSFANTYQKELVKTDSSCLVTLLTYFFLSIFCIYPSFFINWTQFGLEFWVYVVISNILCISGTICLTKALRTGELSILSSVNSYKCVVGLLTGMILLHEFPNIYGVLGLIFIVFGSWIIFETTQEGFSFSFFKRQDVILRILAMILSGIEAVFLKKIILLSSFHISFILWCFGGFVFSLPFFLFSKSEQNLKPNFKNLHKFLLLAIFVGLMQLSTNYIFARLNVGLSLALFQTSTILNLLIGYKLFKEKNILRKLLGIIVMFIGSCLILILNS